MPSQPYAAFSAGMFNFYAGDPKKTLEFFEQAASFAEKTDDLSLISQALFYVGFSNGREGNPFAGSAQMEKALEKCRAAGYLRGQTLAFFGIGEIESAVDDDPIGIANPRRERRARGRRHDAPSRGETAGRSW